MEEETTVGDQSKIRIFLLFFFLAEEPDREGTQGWHGSVDMLRRQGRLNDHGFVAGPLVTASQNRI